MRTHVLTSISTAALLVMLAGCRAPEQEHRLIERTAEATGEVTVSGCLQQADPDTFVVTNAILAHEITGIPVEDDVEPPPPLVGRPSPTGTMPVVGTGPNYRLEPPPDVNLQAHVGRQVQVTGTLEHAADPDRPVGTVGETAAERRDVHGQIVAQEVRLIAQSCV